MSLTGIETQTYSNGAPAEVDRKLPALLIYYGPAWIQVAGPEDPDFALTVLADVYRCARACFQGGGARLGWDAAPN